MKRTKMYGLAIVFAMVGCSTGAMTSEVAVETSTGGSVAALEMTPAPALREAPDAELPAFSASELADLPAAPWGGARLAANRVPGSLLSTWSGAENRDWCAPLAPDATDGAAVRGSALDGGWVFEFDVEGEPSAFGVAGTSMGIDEMLEEIRPAFADGSAADLAGEEEGVAAATIAIRGQQCVYQVWSTRGEAHLNDMLQQLRLVDVPSVAAEASVAELDVFE
jgi:hypothetical protein